MSGILFVGRHYAATTQPAQKRQSGMTRTLLLWRDRQQRRQELFLMSESELKDVRIPRDLVAHESRKLPWQPWHPQLREFEEGARRRIDQKAFGELGSLSVGSLLLS